MSTHFGTVNPASQPRSGSEEHDDVRFVARASRPAASTSRSTASAHCCASRGRLRPDSGLTLVEMLVTLAIIALILSIAWPNLTTGIDGIRLRTSVDNIAVFFTEARNMSDRLQVPVQISVLPDDDQLHAVTIDGSWQNIYDLPDRIHILIPEVAGTVMLFPGAPTPGLRLLLEAEHGQQTGLRFNIFTGVAESWDPNAPASAI